MNRVVFGSSCALVVMASVGCGGAAAPGEPGARAASAKSAASKAAPPTPVVPVPETLAFEAGRFGLTMTAEGWTWKAIRRNVTRFDWSGRPPARDREVLYSFWMDKLDAKTATLLPQIVGTVAANLTDGEPGTPIEQPADVVQRVGVDRIVSACFEPSTFYGKELRYGVLHGIVKNDALAFAVVLANDRAAVVPTPAVLGARGTTPKP
jgi:hypothetical protein